jgi:tetratricopeptide (TPR) repeat protein
MNVKYSNSLLLALLLSTGAVQAQDAEQAVREHFLAARSAQDQEKFDLAVREYLTVLRLQPGLVEALANLGIVYHLQSRYEDSAKTLEKALALRPSLRGSNLFLGIDYVKLNQARRAIVPLRRAVSQEPDNKDAATWLSGALWAAGEENASREQLERAAQRFPDDADVLYLLAEAYRKSARREMDRVAREGLGTPVYHRIFGDRYAAQQAWDKALRHYRRMGAHYAIGVIDRRQGKLDEARAEFALEPAAAPGSAAARAALAELSLLKGRTDEALAALNAAIGLAPDAAAAALDLPPASLPRAEDPGDAQMRQHSRNAIPSLQNAPESIARHLALAACYARLDDARWHEEWARYQALAPRLAEPTNALARAQRALDHGVPSAAVKPLSEFVAAHPNDLAARALLGSMWQRLSLNTLEHLLSVAPDSYRTHQLLAQSWDERDDAEHALAEYALVARLNPELAGLHFAVGTVLWRRGRADEALAEFNAELRRNPGHAESHAGAGTILTSRHEPGLAIPHLEQALRLEPALSSAREELGKALYQQKQYMRAERELKLALPTDAEGTAHYALGMVYRDAGRTEESRAAFAEARRIKAERLAEAQLKSPEEIQK